MSDGSYVFDHAADEAPPGGGLNGAQPVAQRPVPLSRTLAQKRPLTGEKSASPDDGILRRLAEVRIRRHEAAARRTGPSQHCGG